MPAKALSFPSSTGSAGASPSVKVMELAKSPPGLCNRLAFDASPSSTTPRPWRSRTPCLEAHVTYHSVFHLQVDGEPVAARGCSLPRAGSPPRAAGNSADACCGRDELLVEVAGVGHQAKTSLTFRRAPTRDIHLGAGVVERQRCPNRRRHAEALHHRHRAVMAARMAIPSRSRMVPMSCGARRSSTNDNTLAFFLGRADHLQTRDGGEGPVA